MVAGAIDDMVFVRLNVINLADKLCYTIRAGYAGNGAKAGRHEGCPILHHNHIGTLTP